MEVFIEETLVEQVSSMRGVRVQCVAMKIVVAGVYKGALRAFSLLRNVVCVSAFQSSLPKAGTDLSSFDTDQHGRLSKCNPEQTFSSTAPRAHTQDELNVNVRVKLTSKGTQYNSSKLRDGRDPLRSCTIHYSVKLAVLLS